MNEYRYESVDAFIADCPEQTKYNFLGGSDRLPSAKHAAQYGDVKNRELLTKFNTSITDNVRKSLPTQEVTYDVTGLDFDMGMYMSGEPECWYDYTPKPEPNICRIGVNLSAHAFVSKQSMAYRGAMIASVIDCLEQSGTRCEIWVLYGNVNQCRIDVCLKRPDQYLDADRLAFWLCNEEALRVLMFEFMTSKHETINYWRIPDSDKWDINVPRLDEEMTQATCIEFVKNHLQKFGVELNG